MKLLSCLQHCSSTLFWDEKILFEKDLSDFKIKVAEMSTKPNVSRTTATELLLCLAEVLLEANETKQGLDYLSLRIDIFRKGDLHNPERLGAINRYLAELLQERKYSDVKKGIKDYLEPAENSLWAAWRNGRNVDNGAKMSQILPTAPSMIRENMLMHFIDNHL